MFLVYHILKTEAGTPPLLFYSIREPMAVGFLCQIFFVNFCYLFIFLQYFVISEFILLSLHNKKSGIAVTGAQKIFY